MHPYHTHMIAHIHHTVHTHTRTRLALPAAGIQEYGGFAFGGGQAVGPEAQEEEIMCERVTVEDLEGVSDGSDVTSGARVGKDTGTGRVESSQAIAGGGDNRYRHEQNFGILEAETGKIPSNFSYVSLPLSFSDMPLTHDALSNLSNSVGATIDSSLTFTCEHTTAPTTTTTMPSTTAVPTTTAIANQQPTTDHDDHQRPHNKTKQRNLMTNHPRQQQQRRTRFDDDIDNDHQRHQDQRLQDRQQQ